MLTPQEKEISIHIQLEKICDILEGTLTHRRVLNTQGEATKQFIITYKDND
jgi:hypothetical protein